MAEKKFSYKEAIAHGWKMMKKHIFTLLACTLIYILFYAINGVLGFYAGVGVMQRHEVRAVYADKARADQLYTFLQESGYIDTYGRVQKKLQQITTASNLPLSSDFENKRHDIYNFLNHYRYRLPFPKPVYYVLSIILWVVGLLIGLGITKVSLMISRDEDASSTELFSNGRFIIPYILGSICYFLVIMGGFILLIIPGLIFMVMFQFYTYLIVDKGLGPIQSLKRSRVITKGSRWRLSVFGGLLVLLNIAGILCLVIGVVVTMYISAIAMAYVYDKLAQEGPVIPAVAHV